MLLRLGALLWDADKAPPRREADAPLQGVGSPHQEIHDIASLLEANARLRALAIKLSNLLGDLPCGPGAGGEGD
jgi:hypothetical protein